jgi:hypothetical protein
MKAETWFTGISNIKAALEKGMIDKKQAEKLILAIEEANKNLQPINNELKKRSKEK